MKALPIPNLLFTTQISTKSLFFKGYVLCIRNSIKFSIITSNLYPKNSLKNKLCEFGGNGHMRINWVGNREVD